MRTVMIMFDTLTRNYLSNYGCDWVKTPNFQRLEDYCCKFDNFYAGSMPCMPARRDLHTGKYNFLHRSWGPLEPFDFSAINTLTNNNIYTHLCTDHSHYFEDGGCTYHNRYSTWQGFRGQEGDRYMPRLGMINPNQDKHQKIGVSPNQNYANMVNIKDENDYSSVKTIDAGISFIDHYHDTSNWFLQVECFDPHEPFNVPQKYRDLYDLVDDVETNWPPYMPVDDDIDLMKLRKEYASLVSMCDYHLGRILDKLDEYNMWEDTMVIVNTDHGFLLGEHNYIGKNFWPMYQEVSHIPFFLHVPGIKPRIIRQLTSTVDIVPTLLDYFDIEIPDDLDGKSLISVLTGNTRIHDYVIFGVHGGFVNITDGSYVFMKASCTKENGPVAECTMMPTNMRNFFSESILKTAQLEKGDRYSNQLPYLKFINKTNYLDSYSFGDLLFDITNGEKQIIDDQVAQKYKNLLMNIMMKLEAPKEEFERLGL